MEKQVVRPHEQGKNINRQAIALPVINRLCATLIVELEVIDIK